MFVLLSLRLVVVTAWLHRMNASTSAVEANAMNIGPDNIGIGSLHDKIAMSIA